MTSLPARSRRVALAALLLVLGGVGTAAAVWRPIPPADTTERVRLVDAAGDPVRGLWTILPAGDEFRADLKGAGPLRVEIRPVFTGPADSETFRLRVVAGQTSRLFKRRAAAETGLRRADGSGGTFGEVDRLELAWDAGEAQLVVRNRKRNGRALLCRVLLGDGVRRAGPVAEADGAGASATRWSLRADLPQVGWDSNALLTPRDNPVEPESAWFLPVDVVGRMSRDLGGRSRLKARLGFRGAFYDDPVLDEKRVRLNLDGETRLGDGRGTDLTWGYRFTHKDDTFNGRGDRDEFETSDPGGATVLLGDRFDYDEHRLTVGLAQRVAHRVTAHIEGMWRRRDYRLDFASEADIYSLDQDQTALTAGVDYAASAAWRWALEFGLAARDYDEKFARTLAGVEVPTQAAAYRDRHVTLGVEYGRRHGARFHGELKSIARTDRYAGYWDYSGFAVELGGGYRWPAGHAVDASWRRASKDYDTARLDHDPALPLREKVFVNLRLEGSYVLHDRWEAVVEIHHKDNDSNNSTFAYVRTEFVTGLVYRR